MREAACWLLRVPGRLSRAWSLRGTSVLDGLLDRLIGRLTTLAWMALIFALSSIPNNFAPSENALPVDKAVHAMEFGTLAFMIAWLLTRRSRWRQRFPVALLVALAAGLTVLYGATDELHQRFVPGRDVSWADLGADAAGAVIGAVTSAWLARAAGKTRLCVEQECGMAP